MLRSICRSQYCSRPTALWLPFAYAASVAVCNKRAVKIRVQQLVYAPLYNAVTVGQGHHKPFLRHLHPQMPVAARAVGTGPHIPLYVQQVAVKILVEIPYFLAVSLSLACVAVRPFQPRKVRHNSKGTRPNDRVPILCPCQRYRLSELLTHKFLLLAPPGVAFLLPGQFTFFPGSTPGTEMRSFKFTHRLPLVSRSPHIRREHPPPCVCYRS